MLDDATTSPHLWLRHETKAHEQRSPLTPEGARQLIHSGFAVTVERMAHRIFPDSQYAQAGCQLAPPNGWLNAPENAWILGLKELPGDTVPLRHRHVYFAHAFKGQGHARSLLRRFKQGKGALFDLEYLVDENRRRVAAFGTWAGYVGASLALAAWAARDQGRSLPPLPAFSRQSELDRWVSQALQAVAGKPSLLIMGAKGRCGAGARDCLATHQLSATLWDLQETRDGGPFDAILSHDILLNCVLVSGATHPFLTLDQLSRSQSPLIIGDISCDPDHPANPLPVYRSLTSISTPIAAIPHTNASIIAIDHLPTLLPRESSDEFAGQLLPHLKDLPRLTFPWRQAQGHFQRSLETIAT